MRLSVPRASRVDPRGPAARCPDECRRGDGDAREDASERGVGQGRAVGAVRARFRGVRVGAGSGAGHRRGG